MGKKARIKRQRSTAEELVNKILEVGQEEQRLVEEIARLEKLKADQFKDMLKLGEGQQSFRLQDVLSDDQIQACIDILNREHDDIAQARQLKAYLGQFSEQLRAKGLDHNYLAYVLVAMANQQRQQPPEGPGPGNPVWN